MTLPTIKATEEDAKAAARFWRDQGLPEMNTDLRTRLAFAEARLSGYNQGVADERERIAAWIESRKYGDIVHDHETEQHDGTCDEFATAIRAIRI